MSTDTFMAHSMNTGNGDHAYYSIPNITLRDSLKAEKLFLFLRPVSRLRDLVRYRGSPREAGGVLVLLSCAESDGCSSATMSRLLLRMH